MADRGIIFSAPMVRALLDGRKTQTRRLATSPLRKCEVGDRLWVRESGIYFDSPVTQLFRHDVPASADRGFYWVRETLCTGASYMVAGCSRQAALCSAFAKVRPSIHMPRWASRLTLIVEAVKVEPLQSISDEDAKAEGVTFLEPTEADREWAKGYAEDNGGDSGIDGVWIVPGVDCGWGKSPRQHMWGPTPASMYRFLWQSLHGEESWQANPDVVALTFRVERCNIDRIAA